MNWPNSFVSDDAIVGSNVKIGIGTVVESGVTIANDVSIGHYCVVKSGVEIGARTTIVDYVELRSGTVVGEECYIDSRVSSSGHCKIGSGVTLRYGTIIAKGCDIGDGSYLCPHVMTNNLDQAKTPIGGAKVGKKCFVGTQAVLHHGIVLGDKAVVGAMSFATKDVPEGKTVIGVPAKVI